MKAPTLSPTAWAILAAAGVAALVLMRWGDKIAEGATEAAGAAVDMTTGVLTGNNQITQTARTTAYQGAGILGTLGAATDQILGGVPSRIGESLGGWLYEAINE